MKLNYNGKLFYYTANKYKPLPQSNFTISVRDNLTGETIPSEYWGKLLNSTHLPSSNVVNYRITDLKTDLEFINARLDYLRKTLTYWDTYQIKDVIDSVDQVYKIDALEVGKSLIINSPEAFEWKQIICRRGGSFVNTFDQGIVYVPPQAAGIYKPVIDFPEDHTDQINISYEFFTGTPSDFTVESPINFTTSETFYNLSGSLQELEYNDTNKYFVLSIGSISDTTAILPIIAFYQLIDSKEEEILMDYQIVPDGNGYKILIYKDKTNLSLTFLSTIRYRVK